MHFVGVDVGTGSVRAAVFNSKGKRIGLASCPITTWNTTEDHYEQSSADIWGASCWCVKQAVTASRVSVDSIKGIGFDATCSLVLLDEHNKPVTVSNSNSDERNVIVWMDHRALAEAEQINSTKHEVLAYVGNKISPEMEIPKLMWIKRHLPQSWERSTQCFDLADFLTFQATGVNHRSICTTTCKWTYQGHKEGARGGTNGWSTAFLKSVGLEDMPPKAGNAILDIGQCIAHLSEQAAEDLGLSTATSVGVGLIDAHSGGVGMLGAASPREMNVEAPLEQRMALVCGTSSCHMALTPQRVFVNGVWGPYYGAMVPGLWLLEGGQTATGSLLDRMVESHPAFSEIKLKCEATGEHYSTILNQCLDHITSGSSLSTHPTLINSSVVGGTMLHPAVLTSDVHVLPDFHGNRSPRADPSLKGAIHGLSLSTSVDSLAVLYLATIQALAYGTRHILEALKQSGVKVSLLFACGSLAKNPVFMREHADVTGIPIALPLESEAVLLGAAIAGSAAHASMENKDSDTNQLVAAMQRMCQVREVVHPSYSHCRCGETISVEGSYCEAPSCFQIKPCKLHDTICKLPKFHARKYMAFKALHDDHMRLREIMRQR